MAAPKQNTGRPPSCLCGECAKCRKRDKVRAQWQALSLEERRAIVAKRDPEKVRAADRARYYRHWEKRRAAVRDYYRANPTVLRRGAAAWAERNPLKRKAQITAGNAIRDGKLFRQPCEVCGAAKTDAHHDDYSKPLDVRWLCRLHHMEHHRRYEVAA